MIKSILKFGMKKRWPGFGFVTKKLFPEGIVAQNKYHTTFLLDPYEAVEGSVLFDGYFDEGVLIAMQDSLRPGDVFWDIGANVGLHSFTIKKLIPTIQCHAFEPFYKNFARLCTNQELNPGAQVFKYNLALSDRRGIETIHTTINNSGRTSIHALQNAASTDVAIFTTTGDELISLGVPAPHVIKLDTEGSEFAILTGCKTLLEQPNQVRAIIYESFEKDKKLEQLLSSYGFKITSLDARDNFLAKR
ncbi:MAG TPA: FkbM family methyltransferase [Cyclobacteriaceae bacterium]|nr:FkbM family methyltransferase [Cyclobacteriaceae bacterium]